MLCSGASISGCGGEGCLCCEFEFEFAFECEFGFEFEFECECFFDLPFGLGDIAPSRGASRGGDVMIFDGLIGVAENADGPDPSQMGPREGEVGVV